MTKRNWACKIRENVNLIQTHPLQCEGANCVVGECLWFEHGDFDVPVHLAVIRPVFTAFHLFNKRNMASKVCPTWYPCTFAKLHKVNSFDRIYECFSVVKSFKTLYNLKYFVVENIHLPWKCLKSQLLFLYLWANEQTNCTYTFSSEHVSNCPFSVTNIVAHWQHVVVTLQMLHQNKHNLLLYRYFILEGRDKEKKAK